MPWRAWARTLSCLAAPGSLFARENTRHGTQFRPARVIAKKFAFKATRALLISWLRTAPMDAQLGEKGRLSFLVC